MPWRTANAEGLSPRPSSQIANVVLFIAWIV